jgi:hypothetical protein
MRCCIWLLLGKPFRATDEISEIIIDKIGKAVRSYKAIVEALGAASSEFAVISLAVQLGSNIQELINFWNSVKEAPVEVSRIKLQLRVATFD